MSRPSTRSRREGFTLVELLTVIGIISLLISILLPSLSRARDQAKKVSVQAQLDAMGKGLEMFQNDFNGYPDSAVGKDPIDWAGAPAPVPPVDAYMTGAHWLARAMIGHDFGGVDNKAVMLKRGPLGPPAYPGPPTLNNFKDSDPSATPAGSPGPYSDRKGTYLDPQVFIRDDDTQKFGAVTVAATGPNIARIIIIDKYNFPVLYYRANPRARVPFGQTGDPLVSGGGTYTDSGVYNQGDNAAITGGQISFKDAAGATVTNTYANGWDFANSGSSHGLGDFAGSGNNVSSYMGNFALLNQNATGGTPPRKGKSFANFFHSDNALLSGNVAKAQNPDTFFLISAGKDGVYGTDDDVSNSKGGGL